MGKFGERSTKKVRHALTGFASLGQNKSSPILPLFMATYRLYSFEGELIIIIIIIAITHYIKIMYDSYKLN